MKSLMNRNLSDLNPKNPSRYIWSITLNPRKERKEEENVIGAHQTTQPTDVPHLIKSNQRTKLLEMN